MSEGKNFKNEMLVIENIKNKNATISSEIVAFSPLLKKQDSDETIEKANSKLSRCE